MKYEFDTINPVDFSCLLEQNIDNKLMQNIFNRTMRKLNKKIPSIVKDHPIDMVSKFRVDPKFHAVLKGMIRKPMLNIAEQVQRDGINITRYNIDYAVFMRQSQTWILKIYCSGQYFKN